MSKPILNIDLDGVVYPFIQTFRKYIREIDAVSNHQMLPDPTQWEAWEDWNMTKDQWLHLFRRGVEDTYIWREGAPISGAVEGLWALDDAGFFIRIVTNRLVLKASHGTTIFSTAQWLDDYNIPYHSLCMLGGESKATLTGVGLLDDKPGNVDEFQWAPAYLFSQPWNAGYEGEATIVDGWGQAVVELEGLR